MGTDDGDVEEPSGVASVGARVRLVEVPASGDLVHVRGRHWIVQSVQWSELPHSDTGVPRHDTRVNLLRVDEDAGAETASVIWDIAPDMRPAASTPARAMSCLAETSRAGSPQRAAA